MPVSESVYILKMLLNIDGFGWTERKVETLFSLTLCGSNFLFYSFIYTVRNFSLERLLNQWLSNFPEETLSTSNYLTTKPLCIAKGSET